MEASVFRVAWRAMLTDQLKQVRRNPALALITLAGGLLLGVLAGVIFEHGGASAGRANGDARATIARSSQTNSAAPGGRAGASSRAATLPPATAGSNGATDSPIRPREILSAALRDGVDRARGLSGEAAAAVWVYGDAQPVLSGPTAVPHRMWSISKAVVTIAALKATDGRPGSVLSTAMTDAIRRSDNCAIRRVIVGLQDHLGAGIAGTVGAFERVLATSGARIERTPQSARAEQACVRYLDNHQGTLPGSDLVAVPQFGTAEWTEGDAVSFAHALADGAYGAYGDGLLRLMRQPKEPPLEEPPPQPALPLDWGAGAVFPADWAPAWKGGWGGSQDSPPHYLASQIVVLHLGRTPVAVTAIFVPKAEPPNDNPGLTNAPAALERMFNAARRGLEEEQIGGVR